MGPSHKERNLAKPLIKGGETDDRVGERKSMDEGQKMAKNLDLSIHKRTIPAQVDIVEK